MKYLRATIFLFWSLNVVSSAADKYYTVEALKSDGFTDDDIEYNVQLALRCPKYTARRKWNTVEGEKYAEEIKFFAEEISTKKLKHVIKGLEDWVKYQNALLDIERLRKHGFIGPTGQDNMKRLKKNAILMTDSEICQEYEDHLKANETTPELALNIYAWYEARKNLDNLVDLFTFYSTKPFFKTEPI